MGTFAVPLQVGDVTGQKFVDVDALVGTCATYLSIPESILSGLGIPKLERRPFELADESIVEYAIGNALVRLNGEELAVVVVFAPEDSSALLGATTLELFSLGVDPVGQRLAPVPALMK